MKTSLLVLLISLVCGSGCTRSLIVSKVLSGDTIELNTSEKIRYACLESPKEGEHLYRESLEANRYLVEGKKVELILEQVEGKEEKHAYVYTPVFVDKDTVKYLFVNAELVLFGFARLIPPSGKTQHEDLLTNLRKLEERARAQKHGIWGKVDQ